MESYTLSVDATVGDLMEQISDRLDMSNEFFFLSSTFGNVILDNPDAKLSLYSIHTGSIVNLHSRSATIKELQQEHERLREAEERRQMAEEDESSKLREAEEARQVELAREAQEIVQMANEDGLSSQREQKDARHARARAEEEAREAKLRAAQELIRDRMLTEKNVREQAERKEREKAAQEAKQASDSQKVKATQHENLKKRLYQLHQKQFVNLKELTSFATGLHPDRWTAAARDFDASLKELLTDLSKRLIHARDVLRQQSSTRNKNPVWTVDQNVRDILINNAVTSYRSS